MRKPPAQAALFLRLLCVNLIFLVLASRYPWRNIPMGLFISHLPTLGAASLLLPPSPSLTTCPGYRSLHRVQQICVHLCSITHTSQIVRLSATSLLSPAHPPTHLLVARTLTMVLVGLQSLLVN
jgi:hypothetical protein